MILLVMIFFIGVVVGHLETMRQVKNGDWNDELQALTHPNNPK